MSAPNIRFLRKQLDDLSVLATLSGLAFESEFHVNEENQHVIAAIRRLSPAFANQSIEELGETLAAYDDAALPGLLNAIKGIAFEMEFVAMENMDGDTVYASLFGSPSNPDFDVQVFDASTGEFGSLQLKITDDAAYVGSWIDAHPGGEIVVSDELATRLDLPASGIENGELTARVTDVVDRLIERVSDASLDDLLPGLGVVGASLIILDLHRRLGEGTITAQEFRSLAIRLTGARAAQCGALLVALSVPGLNTILAAGLVARFIYSAGQFARRRASA